MFISLATKSNFHIFWGSLPEKLGLPAKKLCVPVIEGEFPPPRSARCPPLADAVRQKFLPLNPDPFCLIAENTKDFTDD
jgi:hypothetical protein